MAAVRQVNFLNMFPGIDRWARAVDDLWHSVNPSSPAESLLPMAYAHVQPSSAMARWMRAVSHDLDTSTSYDHLGLCRLTESVVAASSPLGVWMRQVSAKTFVS